MSWLFEIEIGGVPFLHAAPLIVFGPFFLAFLYHFGLRGLLTPGKKRGPAAEVQKPEARHKPRAAKKPEKPKSPLQWLVQAVAYAAFAVGIAYFSNTPAHTLLAADRAVVKLSLSHPGRRKEECRRRTPGELAKLAPNMRKPLSCPRARWPVVVELEFDGKRILRESVPPRGLSDDGPSSVYRRFTMPAGRHRLAVRVRDRGGRDAFDYVLERDVELLPGRVLVVGFDSAGKRIVVK